MVFWQSSSAMTEPERIRIEVAFDGQQVLSVLVTLQTAEEFERALAGDREAAFSFEAEDGSLHRVAATRRVREALGARKPRRLRRRSARTRMALEVGIVGPSGSGKTSLFTALTSTGGGEYGKTNVGMAPIADERLDALAQVVHARKVTPATIRVQDVPGAGEAQLGNLRQVDALLVVLRGFGAGRRPGGRPRDLHARVAGRRPRPRRAAARARHQAGEVRGRQAAQPRSRS